MSRRPLIPALLAVVAVFIASLNLRPGIASLGVVITDITEHFDAGGASAGVLTALPGFCFAIFGIIAVPLARKIGLTATMTGGMAVSLVGVGLRPWVGDIWVFILLSGLLVAGIAVANVLLPAWIKLHGGKNWIALTTVYTAVLGLGGALGPLSALLFHGEGAWRWVIFIWVFAAVAQLLVWIPVWLRSGNDFPASPPGVGVDGGVATQPKVSLWKSPTAVALMIFFGMQSMNAYIQMGWLPTMLIDAGVSLNKASIAIALLGAFGLLGGLVIPTMIARFRHFRFFPILFATLTIAGYLGIILAPAQGWLLWAMLLGLGGFCFPTALALIPSRTVSAVMTARLSGFVQPVGYLFAGAGPLLVGAAYDSLGGWSVILAVLCLGAVVKGAVGYLAARERSVDRELGLVS
ncbi:putative transporter YycB [Corynebacterium occultum]|uniref:Putative transporter YycB n=1 Tax=Corynebacterium occultum TaxID=2675219 RepID=A0A6B8WIX2_9CORY|nr:MFS transporter [Corynebacterium occultum]QGU06428.1 putative transporter YycB [Corynebacterium occultum]